VYIHEKFPNFCIGVFASPKAVSEVVFWVGCLLLLVTNGSISGDRNHVGS